MADVTVPIGIVWRMLKYTWTFIKSPKINLAIVSNFIGGLKIYYIDNNKKNNFVVNKRLTHHTIYPDGTLISHTEYEIMMLDNGNFEIQKSYTSENDEKTIAGKRKVIMSRYNKIYTDFTSQIKENRFKDYLLVAGLINQSENHNKFIPKIKTKDEASIKYTIKYANQKRFSTFKFYVSITVPQEFNRKNKKDALIIEPIYGLYEFHSKIDKQSEHNDEFYPELYIQGKTKEVEPIKSIYYTGNCWKILNPKKGILKIKGINEEFEQT